MTRAKFPCSSPVSFGRVLSNLPELCQQGQHCQMKSIHSRPIKWLGSLQGLVYPSMAHMAGQDHRPKMATLISTLFCFPNLGRRIRGRSAPSLLLATSLPPANAAVKPCSKNRPLQQDELILLPCLPASWWIHPCLLSGLAETNHHVATRVQQSPANSVKWGWRDNSTDDAKGMDERGMDGRGQGTRAADDAPGAALGA